MKTCFNLKTKENTFTSLYNVVWYISTVTHEDKN